MPEKGYVHEHAQEKYFIANYIFKIYILQKYVFLGNICISHHYFNKNLII